MIDYIFNKFIDILLISFYHLYIISDLNYNYN